MRREHQNPVCFLIFPQGVVLFYPRPTVDSSRMIIHLTFSTACAPTSKKKKEEEEEGKSEQVD